MEKRLLQCPRCGETFAYAPSAKGQQAIEQFQLLTGKPALVVMRCVHCPTMLLVNLSDGTIHEFIGGDPGSTVGSVHWDMEATERTEEEVRRLIEEGDRLNRQGHTAEALKRFEGSIRLRKHEPIAWYNKGVCLIALGDSKSAIEAFRHATQFDPSLVQAWNNMGTMLFQSDHVGEAEAAFDEALRHNPDYPKLYLGKANCRLIRGDVEEARRLLNTALKKDPNYTPAKVTLQRIGQGSS